MKGSVAQEIRSRVADVSNQEITAQANRYSQGRAHAEELTVALSLFSQSRIDMTELLDHSSTARGKRS